MSFKIIKFGGSSIEDAEKIQHVAGIIEDTIKNSELAIVVSASGGAILMAELLVKKGYIHTQTIT